MPQTLTLQQLTEYRSRIASGNHDQLKSVYADLKSIGFNYAGWASGVLTGETLNGTVAVDFLEGTSLLGLPVMWPRR
jgi:hypothetical protein